MEESESSEGWLQGSSYTRGVATSRCTDGWILSSSGQCPLVTLNHPAVQSGPRRLRMRSLATLLRHRHPANFLPSVLQHPPTLSRHLSRIYVYTYIFTMPAYGPARLGVLISSTVPDTLFSLFHPPIYSTSLFLPRHGISPPIFLFIFSTFLLPHPRFPVCIYIYTSFSLAGSLHAFFAAFERGGKSKSVDSHYTALISSRRFEEQKSRSAVAPCRVTVAARADTCARCCARTGGPAERRVRSAPDRNPWG